MTTIQITPSVRPGDYLTPIAHVLGSTLNRHPDHWAMIIKNRQAGTALVLQISTTRKAAQATIRRLTKGRFHVAQGLLEPFTEIYLDPQAGMVTFSLNSRKFLRISVDAQLQAASVNIHQPVPPLPPGRPLETRPLYIAGQLTKSEFSEADDKQIWKGGLIERLSNRDETAWHPLYASGNVAVQAARIDPGETVEVMGTYAQRRDRARQTQVQRALFIVHTIHQTSN